MCLQRKFALLRALSVIRESGRPLVIAWIRSLIDPRGDPRENLAMLSERLVGSELVQSGRGNPPLPAGATE